MVLSGVLFTHTTNAVWLPRSTSPSPHNCKGAILIGRESKVTDYFLIGNYFPSHLGLYMQNPRRLRLNCFPSETIKSALFWIEFLWLILSLQKVKVRVTLQRVWKQKKKYEPQYVLNVSGLIALSQLHSEEIREDKHHCGHTIYSNLHLECSDRPSAIKVLYY